MSKSSTGNSTDSQREILTERLAEAGLSLDCGFDLPESLSCDWSDIINESDTQSLRTVEGNYGVMPGGGLTIVEVDFMEGKYERTIQLLEELPETFTVGTPYDGEHRYYNLEMCRYTEEQSGTPSWNSFRPVAGPGTELNECLCDWHDCEWEGVGRYHILSDRPIANITLDDIIRYNNILDGKFLYSEWNTALVADIGWGPQVIASWGSDEQEELDEGSNTGQ